MNLEIDILAMKAYLSLDKYKHALSLVIDILQRKSISFHILEKLLDFLSFCCAVISLGKLFLRQVFNLLNRKIYYLMYIWISKAVKWDLHWWILLLHQWNDIAIIHFITHSVVTIYTNASETKNIDEIWKDKAFSIHLNRRYRMKYIN